MKEANAPNCGKENELVAFLYGEVNEVEAQNFQQHLRRCTSCKAELAAFGEVHESVVAWRNETLGVISAQPEPAVVRVGYQQPSALAALRGFFNLAPLWMKGAVAFASVLFCVLAGLAIARLGDRQPAVAVIPANNNVNSEQQLSARVAELQEELQRVKKSNEQPTAPPDVVAADDRTPRRQTTKRRSSSNSSSQLARRPLSKTEREQLAADLRLVSARQESDLDLLDDGINQ